MGNFQQLEVWKKAHVLTLEIYRMTRNFPREEQFGITSQIRRAIVSVEINIAEGAGRKTDGDFGRFTRIARGSACEVENLLLICRDLSLLSNEEYNNLTGAIAEISRMLLALANRLQARPSGRDFATS